MGFVEDVQKLDLSDDVKEELLRKHKDEVDPLRDENLNLSAKNRRESVNAEVAQLSDAGFEHEPGALKFYRRVMLSKDAEEPGAILLSDSELELSGDEATGAKNREEISVAEGLRKFVSLLSRNDDGKLKIALSEQSSGHHEDDKPDDGEDDTPEAKAKKRQESSSRIAGKTIERTRKRYGGSSTVGEGV